MIVAAGAEPPGVWKDAAMRRRDLCRAWEPPVLPGPPCQSRPLRARREAPMAKTAPARPSQIAASSRPKPGRAMPPADRPGSSSIVSTAAQPSYLARSASPYCRRWHSGLCTWLNMAEPELAVLSGQCLDRRIPGMAKLECEVAAWLARRNAHHAKASWR